MSRAPLEVHGGNGQGALCPRDSPCLLSGYGQPGYRGGAAQRPTAVREIAEWNLHRQMNLLLSRRRAGGGSERNGARNNELHRDPGHAAEPSCVTEVVGRGFSNPGSASFLPAPERGATSAN